ncbi:MAG: cache domain-containing protein [Spirochaetes bacterium]|nr:cache domain-containing protein [Spirochaetota bacterium]
MNIRDRSFLNYAFFSVLAVILLALVLFFYIPWEYNIFLKQAKKEMEKYSRLLSLQIDEYLQQELGKLEFFNQSQFFRISLFQYFIDRRRLPLQRYLNNIFRQNTSWEALFLFDNNNKAIVSIQRRPVHFSISASKKFFSFVNEKDQKQYFALTQPVRNNFNQAIAYFAVIFDFENIRKIASNLLSNREGSFFILDDKGLVLFHEKDSELMNRPWEELDFPRVKEKGFFIKNFDGQSYLFFLTPSPTLHFYIGIMQNKADYIQPYSTIRFLITAMVVILLVFSFFFITYISRFQTPRGVKLYDAYFENLSQAITQMAKTSEIASRSSQMAYESTKKEVETIKTILEDFYHFIDTKKDISSPRLKMQITENKEAAAEERPLDEKTDIKPIQEKKVKKNQRAGKKRTKKTAIDYRKYPDIGLGEQQGIIVEKEIKKDDLVDIEISHNLIADADDKKEGLVEQDGEIILKDTKKK